MAADFRVHWRVVEDNFPRIIAGMEAKAEALVAKAALDIEALAKTVAPVDTGRLRNAIQAYRVGPAHWRVVVNVEYGVYVEYGTAFTAAQPFFGPAIMEVRPVFLRAMRKVTSR